MRTTVRPALGLALLALGLAPLHAQSTRPARGLLPTTVEYGPPSGGTLPPARTSPPASASPPRNSPPLQAPASLNTGAKPLPGPPAKEAEAPPPAKIEATLPRPEKLQNFDWRAAELKYDQSGWSIVAGGQTIKEFGPRGEEDARRALGLIRELHLNQRGVLGDQRAVLEYWLSDGQPPPRVPRGFRSLDLDPVNLEVENSAGQWVIRDRFRVLFNFGKNAEEARQAVAVFRKYGFNQVSLVGQAAPAMLVFSSREQAKPSLRPVSHTESDKSLLRPGSTVLPLPAVPELRDPTWSSRRPFAQSTSPPGGSASPREEDLHNGAVSQRFPFSWQQVQVRRDGGDWKLVAGSLVLANFGMNERDARTAMAAVNFYRLTEQHVIGGSKPVCSYFLSGGQPPRGSFSGTFSQTFHPDAVTVRQVGRKFCVVQGGKIVLECGERPDEARHMVQVIRQHRFDQVCRIGGWREAHLTILVKSH